MEGQTLNLVFLVIVLLLIDRYVLSGLGGLPKKWRFVNAGWFPKAYWLFTCIMLIGILLVVYIKVGLVVRLSFIMVFFIVSLFKLSFAVFILMDDLRRFAIYLIKKVKKTAPGFLMKAGLIAGVVPLAGIKLTMAHGKYDYHVKRHQLYLKNLPKAFDGMKVGQISDIHSGSFFNQKAVLGGVEMLMREKADVIFFTGDLVNDLATEMRDYQDIFTKVKAPLGVFSILGNHDYGDYSKWPSVAAKSKNHSDLIATHKNMGWNLLRNENRRLKVGNEEIGILGLENWGSLSRFPKYGNMALATKNTNDLPVKLLLSHDPSHWRAQVLPQYPQIDMMFSGHTHGMQMGIQTKDFQWSPVEYIYNEWAGFYQEGPQQLYVNVGYGFLMFQGRIGILPEITIFELKSGTDPSHSKA
jgi:predicted MPP superfamily phosphohydrolase